MRESGFDRIVGASEEEERDVLAGFKNIFDTNYNIKGEKQKSPEQTRGAEAISRYMFPFLEKYGVRALDIRPDQIHFMEKRDLPETVRKLYGDAGGVYEADNQWILIFGGDQDPKTVLAKRMAHEMIHFNSFKSLTFNRDDCSAQGRRLGLQLKSGGFMHFRKLNEAITEELAIRFAVEYFDKIEYTSDSITAAREAYRPLIESGAKIISLTTSGMEADIDLLERLDPNFTESALSFGGETSYLSERAKLHQMIDDIFTKNKDKFKNKDEVFAIFVNAALKGRLLPLARIMNATYGKGSFSQLAEEMQEIINIEKTEKAA
ncbi:MAG: hypothetical protein V4486_02750 [Patescibacteria group bacterium]